MKKIGVVGGVAWRSTVDYYSEICRRSEQWHVSRNLQGVPSTPEMSIESLDLHKAVSYLGSDDDDDEESWLQFDDYHRAALRRLEASGADFALMASKVLTIASRQSFVESEFPSLVFLTLWQRKALESGPAKS